MELHLSWCQLLQVPWCRHHRQPHLGATHRFLWWERQGKPVSAQILNPSYCSLFFFGFFFKILHHKEHPGGKRLPSIGSFYRTIENALLCMKYIYTRYCMNKIRRISKNHTCLNKSFFSLLLTETSFLTIHYLSPELHNKIMFKK